MTARPPAEALSDSSNMPPLSVMQLTDTLDIGGLERVAVNLVNCMPRDRFRPHLCTTRRNGPLNDLVADHVARLCLCRRGRFDVRGLWRLVAYDRRQKVRILHAHGDSLFIAAIASLFPPRPMVLWHNHSGKRAWTDAPAQMHRLAARRVQGVIAVNRPLVEWSSRRLGLPSQRVWYIPNFVCAPDLDQALPDLPGESGGRIVCVANFRPEKDPVTLLRAMGIVSRQAPSAHLLLVGSAHEPSYLNLIREEISSLKLSQRVSLLGQRNDISAILRACDVGVLSSASEGLPLVLIEYGMAGLASVATRVGQCEEVLDEGKAGILVPPSDPEQLAEALLSLLRSDQRRRTLGERFRRRAREVYSADAITDKVWQVYDTILRLKNPTGNGA